MEFSIKNHEGKKYLRTIWPATEGQPVDIDVYCVLEAFKVECQAVGHAIKKLLCAGMRGKGNVLQDLIGAQAALARAIELQKIRELEQKREAEKK